MTTEPSDFKAAKALDVENTCFTPLDNAPGDTEEESPPLLSKPHVTTEPSDLRAAKAWKVENTFTTPLDNAPGDTEEETPP